MFRIQNLFYLGNSYLNRADEIRFQSIVSRLSQRFRRNHLTENCPATTTFERVREKKNKRSRGLGSCGENALEERRRLSDRAANETFTTSVSRTLRSSRGKQFLQADPGLSWTRLPGERQFARLPTCLLAPRGCTFTSLPVLHGCPCARGHSYGLVQGKDVYSSSLPGPLYPFLSSSSRLYLPLTFDFARFSFVFLYSFLYGVLRSLF